EFFEERVSTFRDLKKKDFEDHFENGILKVIQESVLGIFPQSDTFLDPDYRALIGTGKYVTAAEFFSFTSNTIGSAEPSEGRIISAFPTDPWQERALREIKMGKSVVIEGPPGTGKSQLICNLISDSIASGKTVLVVSQKRAALDVIRERMRYAGFQPFIASVFDFRADRRNIYAGIAEQIEKFEDYKASNRSIDAIQTERQYQTASNRIDQIIEELQEFRTALSEEQLCGMSIKEMYLHANFTGPVISLRNELHLLRMDQSDELERKIHTLITHRRVLSLNAAAWNLRKSFAQLQGTELNEITSLIESFESEIQKIGKPIEDATGLISDFAQLKILSEDRETLLGVPPLIINEEFGFLQRIAENPPGGTNDLWLANLQRLVEGCFQGEGVEVNLSVDQLGIAQRSISSTLKAYKNIFSRLYWNLFSPDKFLVKRLLVGNNLTGLSGLLILEKKLDNRLNLEHLVSKLQEKDWTYGIPKTYRAEDFRSWFESTRRALRISEQIQSSRSLKNFLTSLMVAGDPGKFLELIHLLIDRTDKFNVLHQRALQFLLPAQLEIIASRPDIAIQMVSELKIHFDRLCAADRIFSDFQPWERDILDRLSEVITDFDPDDMVRLLHNSMLTGWINYLEARSPVLRIVSSGSLELLEQELQRLEALRRKLGTSLALLRARERITEEVSYNRLNNVVTYRELLHQVTKKRKVWPLRKLISEFSDELFRVVPCWLASPESVSAAFPLERFFDLVIFDEASQCYPEWGIPAMARGKQLVVAGDPQQLRPSDFYRIRWQEEEETSPDLETESLLELVQLQFPSVRLQAHYRSVHPDLIAFSNHHFYHDKLLTIPDRNVLNSGFRPFEYLNVQGEWENYMNRAEAEKVTSLVWQHFSETPEKSAGIITFNRPQQQLISELIETFFQESGRPLPDNLFVKNIENVQGDESDVIIFSTGYAPSPGKKMMLQFGSLNADGGINRLNVAVTRAREKMIIVTSIEPEQLDVTGVKSEGPRMLRLWLEFVRRHSGETADSWYSSPGTHGSGWYLSNRLQNTERLNDRVTTAPFAFADLVTMKDDSYHRIILTDDERYLQSPSPKLHHSFLPDLLRSKNWDWVTCYSRNYWMNQEQLIDKILFNEDFSDQPED
ncbi:MAG: DEAD/DEAH box helicase, partial [Cyclobacteriaceae bacterium]